MNRKQKESSNLIKLFVTIAVLLPRTGLVEMLKLLAKLRKDGDLHWESLAVGLYSGRADHVVDGLFVIFCEHVRPSEEIEPGSPEEHGSDYNIQFVSDYVETCHDLRIHEARYGK